MKFKYICNIIVLIETIFNNFKNGSLKHLKCSGS